MTRQTLTDSTDGIRYKVIGEDGKVLAVEASKLLADMFVNNLTEDQKSKCIIVPITEDNKDILLG